MNELALFAGAGGGLLATKHLLGWRTVCYIEINEYSVEVLKARIRDGLLDDAPIWDDVRTFDGRLWHGCVDIVTAGFPCQPFSQAGKQLAEQDDRDLWPDTIRVIREIQSEWVLLENVPRLLCHDYIRRIFGDLAESGYDCRWDCIPASAIGANHQRDRLWIVAHAAEPRLERAARPRKSETGRADVELASGSQNVADASIEGKRGLSVRPRGQEQETTYLIGRSEKMADANREGLLLKRAIGGKQTHPRFKSPSHWREWWKFEPRLGRVANGVAHRVDRLAAIGDGQVPAVVAAVWRLLTQDA